jgi:hypothetical protein
MEIRTPEAQIAAAILTQCEFPKNAPEEKFGWRSLASRMQRVAPTKENNYV